MAALVIVALTRGRLGQAGKLPGEEGFDTGHAFADDIELVRRLSGRHRFGIVPQTVRVSDRRFRKYGVPRVLCGLLLMSYFFTIGRFEWSNVI